MPGSPLDTGDILGELSPNTIIAIPHQEEFVVVFIGTRGVSARAMSRQQLDGFSRDVIRVHQAIRDDAKIAQLEREFGSEGSNG